TENRYRKSIQVARQRPAKEIARNGSRPETVGITPWHAPEAGMFLWCRLPAGHDAAIIARDCLKEGVVLAPGNAFSQSLRASDYLRFNVAQSSDEKIFKVLGRALSRPPAS